MHAPPPTHTHHSPNHPPNPPQISGSGEVLDLLHDPQGSHVAYVSAVSEAGGRLFIGNLVQDYVSVIDLKAVGSSVGEGAAHSSH